MAATPRLPLLHRTRGGNDASKDLFALFDDTLDRPLAGAGSAR